MSGHIPFLDSPINGVYEANSDRQALKSGPLGDDALNYTTLCTVLLRRHEAPPLVHARADGFLTARSYTLLRPRTRAFRTRFPQGYDAIRDAARDHLVSVLSALGYGDQKACGMVGIEDERKACRCEAANGRG